MRRCATLLAMLATLAAPAAASVLRTPLVLSEPTSLEIEPGGTLLVVENTGRILRVDPASGLVGVVAAGLGRPYAVVRTSGSIVYSAGRRLYRLRGATPQTLATAGADIGPLAAAPNGDLFFATGEGLYRVRGGTPPERIAPRLAIHGAHGLAVARDGALVVADTSGNRLVRVDVSTGEVRTLARVGEPRGLDVRSDGTIYVVAWTSDRVLRLDERGRRLGYVGPRLPGDPYALQVTKSGVVYVVEAGQAGDVQRIGRTGSLQALTRR